MIPIDFPEKNCVYAKDQPEYLPLPVFKEEDGRVWSCWKLTLRERIKIFFTKKLWLSNLTFNQPLQPLLPMVDSPFNPKTWQKIAKRQEKELKKT